MNILYITSKYTETVFFCELMQFKPCSLKKFLTERKFEVTLRFQVEIPTAIEIHCHTQHLDCLILQLESAHHPQHQIAAIWPPPSRMLCQLGFAIRGGSTPVAEVLQTEGRQFEPGLPHLQVSLGKMLNPELPLIGK